MLTPQAYMGAVLCLAVIAAGVTLVGVEARRLLLPAAERSLALAGAAVLAVSALVLLAEFLGTAGQLRAWTLAVLAGLGGAGAVVLRLRRPRATAGGPAGAAGEGPAAPRRLDVVAAVVGVAIVLADWAARTLEAFQGGMNSADTGRYHLPFAVDMIQQASTWGLHRMALVPAISYQPENGSLVSAVAMLPLGRDTLVPLLNFGWLALTLCAAWAMGRPRAAGPQAVLAVCLVCATPLYTLAGAGTAGDDIMTVALLLTAVALLVTGPTSWRPALVGGLAAGLAVGTKLYAVAPLAGLFGAYLWLSGRAGRWPRAGAFAGGALLTGGYWFGRNLAAAGSPIPSLPLRVRGAGFHYVASSVVPYGYSIAHYAGQLHFWLQVVPLQLSTWLASTWFLLLAGGAAGVLFGLRPSSGPLRMAAWTALVGALAYPFTPWTAQTTAISPADAVLMGPNFRYAMPNLALGLLLLGVARPSRAFSPAVLLLMLVEELPVGVRAPWLDALPATVLGAVALAAVGVVLVSRRPRLFTWPRAVAVSALVVVAGFPLQNAYLADRYAHSPRPGAAAFAWARGVSGSAIAVAGTEYTYPLYGTDLSNTVAYPAHPLPDGGWTAITSCDEWAGRLHAGGYRYVVLVDIQNDADDEVRWTRRIGARLLLLKGNTSVFELPATMPAPCGETATG